MKSQTVLTTAIFGLCVIGANMAMKPKQAPKFETSLVAQNGQNSSNRNLGDAPLSSELIVNGLARPVQVTHAPGDTSRIFIVEQRSGSTGRVRIYNLNTGTLNSTPFISLSVSTSSEQGLLGMAFHPNYDQNGYFYLNYTASNGDTYITRYSVSDNPDIADSGSAYTIMTMDQPYSNHNGGWLGFSPIDGYLYIGTGDGGSAGDPGNRSQDITSQKLGKILRIDVDNGSPYSNPADNPFVGVTGDDEIWAYGMRNPWRCDFDEETGDLWIGDVGQYDIEEITLIPNGSGGENHGWRCYEGNESYNTSGCDSSNTMVFPVWQYTHSFGCSVTGGCIYRGEAIPSLDGTYFFGDYCTNRIWSFRADGDDPYDFLERTSELAPNSGSIGSISGFGEDANGEIYICDLGGEVYKIIAAPAYGACCIGNSGTCIQIPESNCNGGGGSWQGPNSSCADGACEPNNCPSDVDGNGSVGVGDILTMIDQWGSCNGCSGDINGDNVVNITDLLEVVGTWGPCN